MVVEAILFPICAVIFLFTLYVLSREDFVFMRKNVSVYDVFDVAVIVSLFALFFARLFYVFFHFSETYLNPLVFFLVPYFPGLSLTGGVIGAMLALYFLTKRKKYPSGRFFDFFAFAFLASLPIASLGYIMAGEKNLLFALLPVFYYSFLFLFFLKILLPRFLTGQMRDGMLGFLLLMNYALFSLVMLMLRSVNGKQSLFIPETGVLGCLFVLALVLYLRHSVPLQFRKS